MEKEMNNRQSMHKVHPRFLQANGLWNHLTEKKKWTITCGVCEHTWSEKVPIHDLCSAICPACRTINQMECCCLAKTV